MGDIARIREQRHPQIAEIRFDLLGVQVSSGSACSAGTPEPSAVITAMLGKARALGAVRVSLGEDLSSAELERAKAAFFQALGRSQG